MSAATRHPPPASRAVSGAVVLTAALLAAGAGLVEASRPREGRVVRSVRLDGLLLRLERLGWLHHEMETGGARMPAQMMPGMPEEGLQRLTVEVAVRNDGPTAATFGPGELVLAAADGTRFPPGRTEIRDVVLRPGESVVADFQFDVPERSEGLALEWSRGGRRVALVTTRPLPHDDGAAPAQWPATAGELPRGDRERGAALYARNGCASCHGLLDAAGSETLGPGLGGLAARRPGGDAAEHVYRSLLDPNAAIAPTCAAGRPCATPSAMPSYADVLALQEAADLVAFLAGARSP